MTGLRAPVLESLRLWNAHGIPASLPTSSFPKGSRMRSRLFVAVGLVIGLSVAGLSTAFQDSASAQAWLESLDGPQREKATYAYDAAERVQWHFIPKPERKGLPLKEMTPQQRQAAQTLLKNCLSRAGYDKASKIIELEKLLLELEKGREGTPLRDSTRYFFTVFGDVSTDARWGLSIEGHHLSLNFVVERDEVVSVSPMFFGVNPTIVNQDLNRRIKRGTRVTADEELIAFDLVQALNETELAAAHVAPEAPADIRAAGETHAPAEPATGVRFADLSPSNQSRLRSLIEVYLKNMPQDLAEPRRSEIETFGWDEIRFAWLGALKPGIGHAYRVQGPSFLIEFVNTQADAEGNPASHIHCVWRDPRGDFALQANP